MNLLGYLITVANIQNYQEKGGPIKDLSIRVSEVQTLKSELQSQPEFPLEVFKETGYYRANDVGKYLSQNLRKYIYNGDVDPKEEGIILTLQFNEQTAPPQNQSKNDDGDISYFVHRQGAGDLDNEIKDNKNEHKSESKSDRNKREVWNEVEHIAKIIART